VRIDVHIEYFQNIPFSEMQEMTAEQGTDAISIDQWYEILERGSSQERNILATFHVYSGGFLDRREELYDEITTGVLADISETPQSDFHAAILSISEESWTRMMCALLRFSDVVVNYENSWSPGIEEDY
jgi:hypothetical protein